MRGRGVQNIENILILYRQQRNTVYDNTQTAQRQLYRYDTDNTNRIQIIHRQLSDCKQKMSRKGVREQSFSLPVVVESS